MYFHVSNISVKEIHLEFCRTLNVILSSHLFKSLFICVSSDSQQVCFVHLTGKTCFISISGSNSHLERTLQTWFDGRKLSSGIMKDGNTLITEYIVISAFLSLFEERCFILHVGLVKYHIWKSRTGVFVLDFPLICIWFYIIMHVDCHKLSCLYTELLWRLFSLATWQGPTL